MTRKFPRHLPPHTTLPAPAGCAHCLAVGHPQPAGDPGCHALADHLHFHPELLHAPTGINQVRTFVGLGNYLEMLKDQTFWETIGRTLYFTVVSVGLEIGLGAGDRAADPLASVGLEVPALQPDHPLGGADHRQRRHVALDLQRRFRRFERPVMQLGLIKHYVPWLTCPTWP